MIKEILFYKLPWWLSYPLWLIIPIEIFAGLYFVYYPNFDFVTILLFFAAGMSFGLNISDWVNTYIIKRYQKLIEDLVDGQNNL